MGYFVGCESESTYRIWDPSKRKVVRLAAARTDDGQGLEDVHEEPDIDQLETIEFLDYPSRGMEQSETENEDETESESGKGVARFENFCSCG